jgi:hypothetical protein
VPPSWASLLLLSREIRDCSPNLTKDVFSLIPVKSEAFLSISSSINNVVLITHPPYAYKYASIMHTKQVVFNFQNMVRIYS